MRSVGLRSHRPLKELEETHFLAGGHLIPAQEGHPAVRTASRHDDVVLGAARRPVKAR
jgi:hypothetical protein